MSVNLQNDSAVRTDSSVLGQTISLEKVASSETPLSVEIARIRESSRSKISFLIVGSLPFIIISSFISLWVLWCFSSPKVEDLRSVLELIISPVIGIVGAVTGFYFGEKSRE